MTSRREQDVFPWTDVIMKFSSAIYTQLLIFRTFTKVDNYNFLIMLAECQSSEDNTGRWILALISDSIFIFHYHGYINRENLLTSNVPSRRITLIPCTELRIMK